MRRFLLTMAICLATMLSVSAELKSFEIKTGGSDASGNFYWPKNSSYTGSITSQVQFGESNWVASAFNNNNNSNTWNDMRCGRKGNASVATIVNAVALNQKVTKFAVETAYAKTGKNDKLNSVSLLIAADKDFTNPTTVPYVGFTTAGTWDFEVPAPAEGMFYKLQFDCQSATNNGFLAIKNITVYYEEGEAPKVAAPTFSMADDGNDNYFVTMTTETEGAEIRYTTNGDEPTATSTLYTAPVQVYETTTFKAVAIKDSEMSRVATFVANPPMVLENFMPLGDADPSEEYSIIVKGKMTAVYQHGAYLYLKDDSQNFALVYGATGTYTNGDTFNRLEGTFVTFNGQPEFKNVTIGEVTPGTPVEPTEAYLDEIVAYNLNQYFKIEGVAISGINGVKATLTDVDGTEAALYNRFNLELTEGENFTITGFVAVYTDKQGVTTYQFYPTEIVAAAETPAAPVPTIKVGETVITEGSVDLKEGEVAEVSFELAEGVEVYYNLTETGIEKAAAEDGLEYTKYTEPIRISKASTLTYYSVVNGVESEKATFTVTGGTTALTEINADANAPVEYFNLQGIRVANPENGVFIRRQGNTVTKVVK